MPSLLMVEPDSGTWNWWQNYPQGSVSIDLQPLPKGGPLGWWHYLAGVQQDGARRGAGIRIGVVDTGLGSHPYLSHVKSLGAVINGAHDTSAKAGLDVLGHGTHVSGIMAARPPQGSNDYAGVASGADVSVIRVFPPQGEANQGDIAEAIDLLSEQGADLINLSLGGPQPSEIERDALRAAVGRGTLCIGAAGNNFGQPVMYPSAYPEVASVSAIGLAGIYPAGSMEAQSLPSQYDRYTADNLFIANFSNLGPQLICTAPGVGIISTVPAENGNAAPYAARSGTSMAAPVACGALASVLAQDTVYRDMKRGPERAQRAATILFASLRPLGLNPVYAGYGLSQAWPN
jgi:subtilisin family serine protease